MTDAEVIAHLARVAASEKTFDSEPRWVERHHREGVRLDLAVALRLDGVLGGGALSSYLLRKALGARSVRAYKVESGQEEKTFPALSDRMASAEAASKPGRRACVNSDFLELLRSLASFFRCEPKPPPSRHSRPDAQGSLRPLPRVESISFSDFVPLCGDVWNCPAIGDGSGRHRESRGAAVDSRSSALVEQTFR